MGTRATNPGEVQVDNSHKVQVRRRWQQDSPSPGEAQLATISRCGPPKDQIHQAQVKPKG